MGSSGGLRLFVASRFIEPVEQALAEAFAARFAETRDPLAELAAEAADADAVVFSLDVPMRGPAIESLPPSVRVLATYSVGTDHIDLEAARERGLVVFNTPGVLADSVAENAIFLMLGAARRGTEAIALLRERAWHGWQPGQLVGRQLSGRTLGILGMGDIGRRIARRARAFDMPISYCNRRPLPPELEAGAEYRATPEALVRDVDVLVLACPATEETRGLVNAALLGAAKPGIVVVNIARGDLVVDRALIDALQSGQVYAAGLDVFAGEPAVHPDYFDLPNVFMLPHVGSATLEARMGMGQILIDAIRAWQRGESSPNRVV
ncbi:MAG: NAD(P)-dependent oxidoreductase [Myxococcota bacterium]